MFIDTVGKTLGGVMNKIDGILLSPRLQSRIGEASTYAAKLATTSSTKRLGAAATSYLRHSGEAALRGAVGGAVIGGVHGVMTNRDVFSGGLRGAAKGAVLGGLGGGGYALFRGRDIPGSIMANPRYSPDRVQMYRKGR